MATDDLLITSSANPRLKALVRLRRRRARDEAGVSLVEGFEELELAVAAGVVPRTVFHCRELMLDPQRQERLVTDLRARGVETIALSRAAFGQVARSPKVRVPRRSRDRRAFRTLGGRKLIGQRSRSNGPERSSAKPPQN